MKIILIGFMGSGKSSVAANLSTFFGKELIELDRVVLARSGRTSINEIFFLDGEKCFRSLERIALAEALNHDNVVISTGGGIVEEPDTLQLLRSAHAVKIFLDASFKTICARIGGDTERPLFRELASAKALYERRLPLYRELADHVIVTDDITPEAVTQKIASLLGLPQSQSTT